MPIPTNITRPLATNLGTLPASATQDVNFGGVTYDVWYKVKPPSDGVLGLFGFGDLAAYFPQVDIYENADTGLYLEMGELETPINVPVYFPVTGGNTYYFNFFMLGSPFVDPAVLTINAQLFSQSLMQAGDFLTNMEVDGDAEFPMAVLAGDADHTVRRYEQMSAPVYPRTQTGLPHGQRGVIFANGNVAWADEQYPNIKIYDKTLAHVATITVTADASSLGISRVMQRMYASVDVGATFDVYAYDAAGTLLDTWATTIATAPQCLAVNGDETILYYSFGGSSAIKRWDLTGNAPLTDLVADTAGYEIQDILYLEDDTLLAVFHEEASTPRDVYVLQLSTAGATLNTYQFGDVWRTEFNAPRIGFALDSPTSFWIVLKPQSNFETSEFRNILISDGSTITTRTHTNYLEGVYIGDATASPVRFGSEKSYPLLVAPLNSSDIPDDSLNGPGGVDTLRAQGRLVTYPIRRVRITPHTYDHNQRLFFSRFELLIQAGVGTVTGQGSAPTIELHCSNDGGFTWPIQRTLSAGVLGAYTTRAKTEQLGMARDRVWKVIQTDPVNSIWVGADVDIEEGSS